MASYSFVTRRRRCHPRAAAIFRATASLATSGSDGAVCFSWLGKVRPLENAHAA